WARERDRVALRCRADDAGRWAGHCRPGDAENERTRHRGHQRHQRPPYGAGRRGRARRASGIRRPARLLLSRGGPRRDRRAADASLLPLRAAELIANAALVALDALVPAAVAARIPKTAEVVYVGKRASAHALPQDQINALLVQKAKDGKTVVRLKGGDPFVFG